MNSSTSEVLWPSPVGAHEASSHVSSTQTELMVDVATAILTAIGSGLFTASVNVTSDSSVDTLYVVNMLTQGSYTVSNDGTNIVISW